MTSNKAGTDANGITLLFVFGDPTGNLIKPIQRFGTRISTVVQNVRHYRHSVNISRGWLKRLSTIMLLQYCKNTSRGPHVVLFRTYAE